MWMKDGGCSLIISGVPGWKWKTRRNGIGTEIWAEQGVVFIKADYLNIKL